MILKAILSQKFGKILSNIEKAEARLRLLVRDPRLLSNVNP